MDTFNPIRAIATLKENYLKISDLGQAIEDQHNKVILAQAGLMDAEAIYRAQYFDAKPCKISEMRDWLKMQTYKQDAEYMRENEYLKILRNRLDILTEVNNNIKASYKIHELEARSLNLN